MRLFIFIISIFLSQLSNSKSQSDGVKTIISSFLRECYSESRLLNRNNLPPMTLPVLLDIIRKVEDSAIGDMRQISTAIVHLFRQDGIVYDPAASGTPNVVPFSPTGFQAYKNRMLTNKLLPNNLFNIPNEFLIPEDKCGLHLMMSNSIELQNRGDEEWTCTRMMSSRSSSRLSEYRKSQDVEMFDVNGTKDILGRQIMGISNCPIETGVVSTPWGEVSMGTVVTGISAGLEEQKVLVSDLVNVRSGFDNITLIVNNRYAATLAGDIAEAAIRQGVSRNSISVGVPGTWNSTNARRHYFLVKNENLELTDAEIRAGLDGLILSELASTYVNTFPEFKLSQLLDMYYSHNGILHTARFRACNRKVLVPDIATTQTLREQSLGPAVALYHLSALSGTTNLIGVNNFVNNTVDAFHRYIAPNINDPVCNLTNAQVIRGKINLILITDPTLARSAHISYIVDQIEVGKFGSSITLLNSANGDVVVEKTFSIATFYESFAKNISTGPSGSLDVLSVLQRLIGIATVNFVKEQSDRYCGGNSTVALFLSDTVPIAGTERVQVIHRANWLKNYAPDLRIVFATSSASEAAVTPMLRQYEDFIPITLNAVSASAEELRPVVDSLLQTPRRIVNPECGSKWLNINSGIIGFEGFVDADGINLYRIMPNYFYGSNSARLIRVQSTDYGSVTVCYSRTSTFPRRNRTTSVIPGDVSCESAVSDGIVEISLDGACNGFSTISDCPPVYLTVASTLVPTTPQCRDFGCRYPNDIKYLVMAHDLGCYNKSEIIYLNKNMLILMCLMICVKHLLYN